MMLKTIAFDVYGTLVNTHGVVVKLGDMVGDKADEFSRLWRDKQLEYSFRRGLMQRYEKFAICIRDSLEYTCSYLDVSLTPDQKDELLVCYRTLPAFDDVFEGLEQLKADGFRLYAFSNGSADAVEELLMTAKIRDYFLGVVSVDDVQSFKPNPAVYEHFLKETCASGNDAWLISSNPFDVIGAVNAGMKAAWVQRNNKIIYDPWGIEPTITVEGLKNLNKEIKMYP